MRNIGAQGRTGFLIILINTSCTTYKRKAPQKNIFVFFLQNTLKTAFQMRTEPIDVHKQSNFFRNQDMLFLISKEAGGDLLPSPC